MGREAKVWAACDPGANYWLAISRWASRAAWMNSMRERMISRMWWFLFEMLIRCMAACISRAAHHRVNH